MKSDAIEMPLDMLRVLNCERRAQKVTEKFLKSIQDGRKL